MRASSNYHSRPRSDQRRQSTPVLLPASFAQHEAQATIYPTADHDFSIADHFEMPPAKRPRLTRHPLTAGGEEHRQQGGYTHAMDALLVAGEDASGAPVSRGHVGGQRGSAAFAGPGAPPAATPSTATKSKRVRTGCLTCRERHLKCDETVPDCLNCRKSNRECKRGIRLNFIDVQVKRPPYMPPTQEWSVQFQDESRLIASEYLGGLGRYAPFDQINVTPPRESDVEELLQHQSAAADHLREPGGTSFHPLHSEPGRARAEEQRATYLSGALAHRPDRPEPDERAGYDDGELSRAQTASSQRSSETFATTTGHLSGYHHHQDPSSLRPNFDQFRTPNMAVAGGYADPFSLAREDAQRDGHAYHRTSDVSSVASSLPPLGPGSVFPPSSAAHERGHLQTAPHEGLMTPPSERGAGAGAGAAERDCLTTEEEIHYMKVFVNEVAIWMDSFDKHKHFSRIIPYRALRSPMLLNAFLACGVKHLTLVDPSYNEDKALFYYDTATTQLLRSLQNPDRDMVECATTAVVLNVYEIMSEKPTQRMSHIAGARALIRECGWNARSPGIGAACFWLNIGMEVLSCLAFNWQTAWDPDQWGMDLQFTLAWTAGEGDHGDHGDQGHRQQQQRQRRRADGGDGTNATDAEERLDEEVWVHRIFYIVAKIANFRANTPRFQDPSPHDEQVRLEGRFAEWKRLKALCDAWDYHAPRSMKPFGYASNTSGSSRFPNIWLIKRAAIVGRLFFHTAMCLLAQINPLSPKDSAENRAAQLHHAHQVCGIVAHTKDRGVASAAIRSLAIASSVLVDVKEQREVLAILDRIHRDTGWRLGKVLVELKKAWGWESSGPIMLGPPAVPPPPPPPQPSGGGGGGGNMLAAGDGMTMPFFSPLQTQQPVQKENNMLAAGPSSSSSSMAAAAAAGMQAPARRPVNPLLVQADFSHPNHPYQQWYEPPNRTHSLDHP